ncbi:TetR family transcriptional regulator [Nonlabens xylanidelens]|uniref:TetR family transcriptional regulator n=1 Tax=Nonlabens xylanidelens TaxID=191564 RepID=A0A2S6IIQ8_9FLAO|nr:TetR/AcrR family transcriptional regulator [Nonlabens xylanidelens]PPK94102.1 TetR family transcriptional regulator [Nonlabens xylanidelens]PQJ22252.1 TetR family transcriptional regulator [Nonlabens xylanidelens]
MKHAEVKNRIIETASFLFYKNGYNSTGINQIIAEAGIAKATLYNHFKSKEEICLAYLKFKNINFLTDFQSFTQSRKKGKDQILAIFDFLKLFYQDKDFNGCWCIKTVSEIPKDNEIIRNEIQSQKNSFIAIITQLVKHNIEGINGEQVNSLSRQIYLLYESAVGESHLHQQDWPIIESKNLCEKIIA